MSTGFKTYNSRESVKARKVTDKEGETVVTSAGNEIAPHGAYVVDVSPDGDGSQVRVMDAESFDRAYKAPGGGSKARKGSSKGKTQGKAPSAAQRVSAARKSTARK